MVHQKKYELTDRASKYLAEPPVMGRECGGCTACCVLPRIKPGTTSLPLLPEGKIGYIACQHLCASGCSHYSDRPAVCRDFACLWKDGMVAGDDRRRPDNLGLMFTVDSINDKFYVEAWELWQGAAADHPGKGVLDGILESVGTILVRYYGVPCSLEYSPRSNIDPVAGRVLSAAAANNPKELLAWVVRKMELQELHLPDAAALRDLDYMKDGNPVLPHFKPKVQQQ